MARKIICNSLVALGLATLACNLVLDMNALDDGCPAGQKACDGSCVSFERPEFGCASETCDPCSIPNASRAECVDGECAPRSCSEGYKPCGTECVDVSDPAHGCGDPSVCEPCPGGDAAICVEETGRCGRATCEDPGSKLCDAECVPVDDPEYGCGGESCSECSAANATAFECNADTGACVLTTCRSGFKVCPRNVCADVLSPDTGCGSPTTCATCVLAHTSVHSCSQGSCFPLRCEAGYDNCDNLPSTGCEANLITGVKNCGRCGNDCSVPKYQVAESKCTSSQCKIAECNPGFSDCDGAWSNGCETASPTCP